MVDLQSSSWTWVASSVSSTAWKTVSLYSNSDDAIYSVLFFATINKPYIIIIGNHNVSDARILVNVKLGYRGYGIRLL